VAAARRHHLDPSAAHTSDIHDVLRPGDLVVAVCDNAHEELASASPMVQERRVVPAELHWAVPDPVRLDTDEAFEVAFEEITRRVDRLAAAVASQARRAVP